MRRFWVGFMLFFAVTFMVLATVSAWIRATVIDTDGFVSLTTEIIDAPEVQDAIADRIVDVVFSQPHVDDAIVEVIPEPLRPFQDPIISGAQAGLRQAVVFLMNTKAIGDVVETEVTKAQVDLVDGKDITFGLSDLADALGLSDKGGAVGKAAALIPDDFGTITVLKKEDAPWLYQIIDLLENLWLWLLLGSLALFAGAFAASHRRRKTFYAAALSLGITSVVVIIAIEIGRSILLGSLPSDVSQSAAETIVGIVVSGLRTRFIWVAVLSFVAFGIALAWGRLGIVPSVGGFASRTWANVRTRRPELATAAGADVEQAADASRWQRMRRDLAHMSDELEIGARIQQAADYVDGRIRMLRGIGVIVGAVILLLWPAPTTAVVIWIAALVILYLGALEILAGRAEQEIAPAGAAQVPPELEAARPLRAEPEQPAGEPRQPEPEPEEAEPAPVEPAPQSYEERLGLLRQLGELKELGILDAREVGDEKERIPGTQAHTTLHHDIPTIRHDSRQERSHPRAPEHRPRRGRRPHRRRPVGARPARTHTARPEIRACRQGSGAPRRVPHRRPRARPRR